MLLSIAMRSALLPIVLVFAAAAACSDEKPEFGNAGGILGRRLPGETSGPTTGGSSGGGGGEGIFPDKFDTSAAAKPATTLRQGHNGIGLPLGTAINATGSSNCLDCHKTGGQAAGKIWSFGGRVLNTAGNAAVANADVIVVNGDGKIVGYVKTDADGFFWAAPGANVLADGAKTAVRTAGGITPMGTTLNPATDGGCDRAGTCHQSRNGIKSR